MYGHFKPELDRASIYLGGGCSVHLMQSRSQPCPAVDTLLVQAVDAYTIVSLEASISQKGQPLLIQVIDARAIVALEATISPNGDPLCCRLLVHVQSLRWKQPKTQEDLPNVNQTKRRFFFVVGSGIPCTRCAHCDEGKGSVHRRICVLSLKSESFPFYLGCCMRVSCCLVVACTFLFAWLMRVCCL